HKFPKLDSTRRLHKLWELSYTMIPEIFRFGFITQFRESELGGATQIPEVRFYTQAPQTSGNILEVIKNAGRSRFCSLKTELCRDKFWRQRIFIDFKAYNS
ncbi:MAG: hypothetical protein ABIG69_15265, partial [Bacteroidota bacterium]